jgi:hypothetical protein
MKTDKGPKYCINTLNPQVNQTNKVRLDREVRTYILENKIKVYAKGWLTNDTQQIIAEMPDGTELRLWRLVLQIMAPEVAARITKVGILNHSDYRVESIAIISHSC